MNLAQGLTYCTPRGRGTKWVDKYLHTILGKEIMNEINKI